jgi:polyhydroxyalkanoate synthesis repressor PhaR
VTEANGSEQPIIIKKYANRRLYDTSESKYVTLNHLSELVRAKKNFHVLDAKSGENLTRSVLAQIIFDQENRADGVLPVSFLRQIIQFYGDSFQSMLPAYLEISMKGFFQQQEKWRDYMHSTLGDADKAEVFDSQVRKNMEMFEETMSIFTPCPPQAETDGAEPSSAAAAPGAAAKATPVDAIQSLQQQMLKIQKQLASMAMGRPVKRSNGTDDEDDTHNS